MENFGIVYIRTNEPHWKTLQQFSESTLPQGTQVEVIEASDFADCFLKRLTLVNNLPFKRTLYVDCDVVYCSKEFPDWVFNKPLQYGLGATGWAVANQVWNASIGWLDQFDNVYALANLPNHFRWVSSGLMLIEESSKTTFDSWVKYWQPNKLLEPAFMKAFWNAEQQPIDFLPNDFHIPSWHFENPYAVKLPKYYFVHAIGDGKLDTMNSLKKKTCDTTK